MVQQGGAGHRQVGHAPGTQQIAEVDHPLHLPVALLITVPDHVVIGNVQVHGLDRQLRRQWLQAGAGGPSDLFDLGVSLRIRQGRQQVLDQRLGMARVPLQRALQARVVEAGERLVDPGAQRAQLGDYLHRQVFQACQWLAVDVFEQPHPQRLAIDVQRQQLGAITGQAHRRDWQPWLRR